MCKELRGHLKPCLTFQCSQYVFHCPQQHALLGVMCQFFSFVKPSSPRPHYLSCLESADLPTPFVLLCNRRFFVYSVLMYV